MSKIKLELDFEPNFELVGISTPLLAHKVSFFLNSSLNFQLSRIDDLELLNRKNKKQHFFKRFEFLDDQYRRKYYLISNKDQGNYCLSSYSMIDYIILVKGKIAPKELENLIKKIKQIIDITYVVHIPLENLPGVENLMFERIDGKDTF